jgi:hypothetical protein
LNMFEAFPQIAFLLSSGLSPFNYSQYRIRAIFSLSVHYEGTFSNFVRYFFNANANDSYA